MSKTFYGHTSLGGPALALFDPGDGERLYMAWIDRNNRLMIGQGVEFGLLDASQVVDANTFEVQTSRLGPALALFNGELYVSWVDASDQTLNVMSTCDGFNWDRKSHIPNETSLATPALSVFAGRLWLGWTGTDSAREGGGRPNVRSSVDGFSFQRKHTLSNELSGGCVGLGVTETGPGESILHLTWTELHSHRIQDAVLNVDGEGGLHGYEKVAVGFSSCSGTSVCGGSPLRLVWLSQSPQWEVSTAELDPQAGGWSGPEPQLGSSLFTPAVVTSSTGTYVAWTDMNGNQLKVERVGQVATAGAG
jgi:hypothetical protein